MAPPRPHFPSLPVELICRIGRLALASDIPAVGARGLLLEDSYVSALRDWRAAPEGLHALSCLPHNCCFTRRGARSGQALTCYKDDFGPARSALDLLEVSSSIRAALQGDPLFWGEALLLRSNLIDLAIDRALHCDHPRLSFTAQGGICLCALAWLNHNIELVTRIDLALPSTNIDDDDSPSHIISSELHLGAPNLQAVDLRFDWAHAHADAKHKTILLLPTIKTCRLLNATFALGGATLTSLFLAAEEAAFRWRRADIFKILRACPNVQTLALQMIFVDTEAMSFNERVAYPRAGLAVLPNLRYCMISDTPTEWDYACEFIQSANELRVHADVILPMSRVPGYSMEHLQVHCDAAMTAENLQNIGNRHRAMAVRIRRATALDERLTRWPEYISLSFGDDLPSAMTFRDPVRQKSAGSFTIRNAALSMTAVETPWIHLASGGPPAGAALDAMMRGCANLGIRHVETFALDVPYPFVCPEQWPDILSHLSGVRTIVIFGLQKFSSPEVLQLARALGRATFVINDDEDEDDVMDLDETYACPLLRTVRLPHAQGGVHGPAIVWLNSMLKRRCRSLSQRISWEV